VHTRSKFLPSLLIAGVLVILAIITGCAEHTTRVYDPYYSDYHVWDRNEVVYYQRWEGDTHREHKDFNRRSADEQKEYWNWRHRQH
jgi:hypothetical protein